MRKSSDRWLRWSPTSIFPDAVAAVNASRYGLKAGLLTRDAGNILEAFRALEVGR